MTQLERTEQRFIGLFRDFRDEECRFHIFENVFCNFYRPQRVEKGSNYVLNLTSDPQQCEACGM